MQNKRILITGGAGFIGSELVRQILVQETKQVIVVDNLVNGRQENLKELPTEKFELVVADIRDSERMAKLMSGIDIVFHLACLGVRHSIHSPYENHEVNATATLELLRAAKAAEVSRFIYVSSSEVYGTARWVPMTEEHPTFPMTVYGASKLAGECYARAFYETYGYPTVVVRPFNSYGPRCHHEGDSGEVIPKFLLRRMAGKPMVVFGDGTQSRDFTYVSDTARGIMMAGFTDSAVGQTINLGSGFEIAINDLAQEIASIVEQPDIGLIHDEPRPGDVLRLYAETTKAYKLLGFKPQVSLREGLIKLRNWYLRLGQSPELLLENELVRNWDIARVK
ncbi:SDR family NAD(P)-dependent oxidoreductase [Cuspidothrix issatschenkoi LEGE 03284]|uniref:SDR family NAD(P)-dependent oxidoreductase n=1 Tax=Cuspidothrix issatschenkoi TaxID=230752 RepID=UPI00188130DB|nr:SDR family NAD(P)-dependent oxidoreductase [Cuspidothrix issatschenkoi]MBE9233109.1 SDR family NAD(P)-dependent oxidoreductase [Cuspidothrix issatschenkoi LEGE 03284]